MRTPTHDAPENRVTSVSRTLWYEVAMLRDLYSHICSDERKDAVGRNALLEAFLLHGRQLFWFFSEDRKYTEDAHALDLIDKEALRDIRERMPNDWQEQSKAMSQHVMHMTLHRGKSESYRIAWRPDAIYVPLNTAWRLCYERADRQHWADLWGFRPTPSIGEGLPRSGTGETETAANRTSVTYLAITESPHNSRRNE